MLQLADWYFAIVFFVTVLGFLVSGILFFVNKTDTFSSKLLAGYLVSICILVLNNELMVTKFFLNFPHLWRATVFVSFCFQAFGYLYVRSVLEQAYTFKKWDFLFFLPALLYPLALLPFYVLPAQDKLLIIQKIIADSSLIAKEPESILPAGVGTLARSIFGIILCFFQFKMLFNWKKKLKLAPTSLDQNNVIYNWLFYFSVMCMLLYVLALGIIIFQLSVYFSVWHTLIFAITTSILFNVVYLLFRPNILYGMTGWLQQPIPQVEIMDDKMTIALQKTKEELPRTSLTLEQGMAYKSQLENHFHENKPFIKGGYTMGDLSRELSIPSHQLSAFINQEYGKNFNELINNYRVAYLEKMVAESPEYLNYTLEALGQLAGFKSRASFYSAVKKKTGLTPASLFSSKTSESTIVLS
jgi:AraC-like DNA-binding protein